MKCPNCGNDSKYTFFPVEVDNDTYMVCVLCDREWDGDLFSETIKAQVFKEWLIELERSADWYRNWSVGHPHRDNVVSCFCKHAQMIAERKGRIYKRDWRDLVPDDEQLVEPLRKEFAWLSNDEIHRLLREAMIELLYERAR